MTENPGLAERDASRVAELKVVSFFPADHAVAEGGKVYANGAFWSLLRFPAFPITMPALSLVAVISVPWHASNADHVIRFGLEDSDAKPLPFEIMAQFRSAPSVDAQFGSAGIASFALPVFGLTFERPGGYVFTLQVDGQRLADWPIEVRQVSVAGMIQAPAPPGPTDW